MKVIVGSNAHESYVCHSCFGSLREPPREQCIVRDVHHDSEPSGD